MSAEVHHIIFDFVRYFRHCVVSGPNSLYVFYYLRFPCRTSTRRGVWISVQFRLQRFRVYGYFSTVYLVSRAACGAVHANVETKSSLSEFVSEVVFVLEYEKLRIHKRENACHSIWASVVVWRRVWWSQAGTARFSKYAQPSRRYVDTGSAPGARRCAAHQTDVETCSSPR